MNILYIKRAYNTRVHAQAHALAERGHRILLLLESPVENGYSGPGQWDAQTIASRLRVMTVSSRASFSGNSRKPGVLAAIWGRMEDIERGSHSARIGFLRRKRFLGSVDRLLSTYPVDLIFSGNDALPDEDQRTLLLLDRFGGRIPIVYDCQDILTDCFMGNPRVAAAERAIHERADGVIHTNPFALQWAASRYALKKGCVFSNYSSTRYFQKKSARISASDGRIHLVYCGGVQKTPRGNRHPFARDMKRRFREIAALGHPLHLHLGVYPGSAVEDHYRDLTRTKNIQIHPYLSFSQMMQALSRYDVGLLPLDLGSLEDEIEKRGPQVLDRCRFSRIDTSKQYEYTLAGLPVLTAPIAWVSQWLCRNHFGRAFHTIGNLGEILESGELKGYQDRAGDRAPLYSIEHRIGELENFLAEVAGK